MHALTQYRHPQSIEVVVVALEFYTQYPDGVGDAINIFIFPNLSPSTGYEAALMTRLWDDLLGENNFNYFAETSTLLERQKVVSITIWDADSKQI